MKRENNKTLNYKVKYIRNNVRLPAQLRLWSGGYLICLTRCPSGTMKTPVVFRVLLALKAIVLRK